LNQLVRQGGSGIGPSAHRIHRRRSERIGSESWSFLYFFGAS
jgi:hypothetical protein